MITAAAVVTAFSLSSVPVGAWALIGTLFGGAGLKVVEKWLSKSSDNQNFAKGIRDELRGEIKELRDEIDELRKESDKWRVLYFDVQDEYLQFRTILSTKVDPQIVDELRVAAKTLKNGGKPDVEV